MYCQGNYGTLRLRLSSLSKLEMKAINANAIGLSAPMGKMPAPWKGRDRRGGEKVNDKVEEPFVLTIVN